MTPFFVQIRFPPVFQHIFQIKVNQTASNHPGAYSGACLGAYLSRAPRLKRGFASGEEGDFKTLRSVLYDRKAKPVHPVLSQKEEGQEKGRQSGKTIPLAYAKAVCCRFQRTRSTTGV